MSGLSWLGRAAYKTCWFFWSPITSKSPLTYRSLYWDAMGAQYWCQLREGKSGRYCSIHLTQAFYHSSAYDTPRWTLVCFYWFLGFCQWLTDCFAAWKTIDWQIKYVSFWDNKFWETNWINLVSSYVGLVCQSGLESGILLREFATSQNVRLA